MKYTILSLVLVLDVAVMVADQIHSIRVTGHRRTPWTETYRYHGADCWENWGASACSGYVWKAIP
jgi:hypothetical protein